MGQEEMAGTYTVGAPGSEPEACTVRRISDLSRGPNPAPPVDPEPTRGFASALWNFLTKPIDCPIHDTCVRIGLTMVAGLWVMLLIVNWR